MSVYAFQSSNQHGGTPNTRSMDIIFYMRERLYLNSTSIAAKGRIEVSFTTENLELQIFLGENETFFVHLQSRHNFPQPHLKSAHTIKVTDTLHLQTTIDYFCAYRRKHNKTCLPLVLPIIVELTRHTRTLGVGEGNSAHQTDKHFINLNSLGFGGCGG